MNEIQDFIKNFAESKDMDDQINQVLYKKNDLIEANVRFTIVIDFDLA